MHTIEIEGSVGTSSRGNKSFVTADVGNLLMYSLGCTLGIDLQPQNKQKR